MIFLLNLLLAGFETFLLFYFYYLFLSKNDELKLYHYLAFVFYFIFQLWSYLDDSPFFSTSIYYTIFAMAIALLFYYNQLGIKLITASLFVTLNYTSKLFSLVIFSLFNSQQIPSNPFDFVLTQPMQLAACSFFFIVTTITFWLRKFKFNNIIFSIIIFIIPIINLFSTMRLIQNINTEYMIHDVVFLLMSYTIFLFFVVDQIIHNNKQKQYALIMEERMAMQNKYYKDIEVYNKKVSALKHDMKNHLSMIQGMLMNEEYVQAINYINTYTHSINQIKSIVNSSNPVIDILLNTKATIAQKNGIKVNHELIVPPYLPLDSVELSILLANLYDNAIEGCLKIEQNRFIDIHIKQYKNSLYIQFKNSYDGIIMSSEKQLISRKVNREEHGFGLQNIKEIIKKHQGSMQILHENKIFDISLIIPFDYTQ